ncbi:hypothetical protein HanIR_Chr09g0443221 [Helianthus annuus]|nr:hypothetical protein HanIR_Chr09g0443221 [Helianthus annuus]
MTVVPEFPVTPAVVNSCNPIWRPLCFFSFSNCVIYVTLLYLNILSICLL